MKPTRRFLFALTAFLAFLSPSHAGSASDPKHVTPTLISETTRVAPGQTLWVALQLVMQDGWHVYWQNPGDSGSPVKIDWTLPPGFTTGEIRWPNPELIVVEPVYTYGYEKEA